MKLSASLTNAITAAALQGFGRLWIGARGSEMSEVNPCGYPFHLNHHKTRDERPGFQGLT